MGAATDISVGIATVLAGAGIGVTYNPSGVYSAGQLGVYMKDVPAAPDRVVVLSVIPMSDELAAPSGQVLVQVRTRGLPGNALDVDDLADTIKPFLHGLKGLTWGSVQLVQMVRNNAITLGQDTAKRWERADDYTLDVEYPGTVLVPNGGTY